MENKIRITDTYKEVSKRQKKDTINFLVCIRHDDDVLKNVKLILKNYQTMLISGLYKYFYRWFEAEYAFNQGSHIFPEKMWEYFDIMMVRILSIELLYAQFPKEDKTNEILRLFILRCNKYLGSWRGEIKNLPLLNPENTYNNIYPNFEYYFLDNTMPYRDTEAFKEHLNDEIKEITKWNEKCEYYF